MYHVMIDEVDVDSHEIRIRVGFLAIELTVFLCFNTEDADAFRSRSL